MQKIGDITDSADGNGEFTDGNVAGNIMPTELMASWFNTIQRELIAVLTEAGLKTDKTDDAQLVKSIRSIMNSGINAAIPSASLEKAGIVKLSSATDSSDETTAATSKAVKAAYDMAKSVSINGIYPVGIVVWFAQNKDPNTLFPGTTWKYIGENKTVRLAAATGADVMTTGGSDSVTLAVGNLPAHGHTFSANTSSFDHGTKSTNSTGAHTHTVSGTAASAGNHTHQYRIDHTDGSLRGAAGGDSCGNGTTEAAGAHTHTVSGTAASSGAHTHTVAVGAHTHSVSGTTANTGSGTAISVTNAYIKLMSWYRSA